MYCVPSHMIYRMEGQEQLAILAIPHYYGCMSIFLNYAETYHLQTVSAALVKLSMPVCTVL